MSDQGPLPIRRRFLLAGAACAGLVGVLGTGWLVSSQTQDNWVKQVVRKYLPGLTMDEESLSLFAHDIRDQGICAGFKQQQALWIDTLAPDLSRRTPILGMGLDRLERRVLSEFLVGSNLFRVPDPHQETIKYFGRATVCSNPFATFRDA